VSATRAVRCLAAVLAGVTINAACTSSGGGRAAQPTAPTTTQAKASPKAPASKPTAAPQRSGVPKELRRFYSQRPSWRACGDGYECARVTVPLDYNRPGGGRIGIAVTRLPATKKAQRIGSLLINPGGPGVSGVEYARYARSVLPRALLVRFDIVGFDPRGVGESAPVRCLSSRELDEFFAVDPSPDSQKELDRLTATSRDFAAACKRRSATLLPFVSTREAARDMDILRSALGDAKLSYLGKSYGTYLGAWYAELFPTRVRALLLDGAVDPSLDGQELGRVQALGFEQALGEFLSYCADTDSCEFGRKGDIDKKFDALMRRIDAKPLSTQDRAGRRVGPDEAFLGVASALYSREYGWPALAQALTQAENGDGTTLLRLFDNFADRDPAGRYSNQMEANLAINCIDRPSPRTVSAYGADARAFAAQAPRFGAALAYTGLPCAFWSVPPVDVPRALTAPGAPPILVVGTTRDPATPLRWAEAMADQLQSGVLLVYDGDGHTAYGDGVPCVDDAGSAYLISLTVPKDGTRC
jgi:pimeloyl-ACP methyl ester carboxylesterase